MSDVRRFDQAEMYRLARSAVSKIDLLGPRGTTLCTMDEIDAMAVLLATSGALTPPQPANTTRAEHFGSLALAIQPIEKDKSE